MIARPFKRILLMTNHDAAVLGIRLSALYAAFQGVEYLSMTGMFLTQRATVAGNAAPAFFAIVYLLPSALLFWVGLWLFKKAPELAGYFFPISRIESPASQHGTSALAIGFGIAGLIGVILSVPKLIPPLITLLTRETPYGANQTFLVSLLPHFAGTLFQAILSFVILVKSRALAEWWQRKQG
jgi:hypothetical protein